MAEREEDKRRIQGICDRSPVFKMLLSVDMEHEDWPDVLEPLVAGHSQDEHLEEFASAVSRKLSADCLERGVFDQYWGNDIKPLLRLSVIAGFEMESEEDAELAASYFTDYLKISFGVVSEDCGNCRQARAVFAAGMLNGATFWRNPSDVFVGYEDGERLWEVYLPNWDEHPEGIPDAFFNYMNGDNFGSGIAEDEPNSDIKGGLTPGHFFDQCYRGDEGTGSEEHSEGEREFARIRAENTLVEAFWEVSIVDDNWYESLLNKVTEALPKLPELRNVFETYARNAADMLNQLGVVDPAWQDDAFPLCLTILCDGLQSRL